MVHVYGYCLAHHRGGSATAYCACGWSATRGTATAADAAAEAHNAERAAEARRRNTAELVRIVLNQRGCAR